MLNELQTAYVKDTGWPIDGHTLILSLWGMDNYESWHLCNWPDESDRAIMETMFITETAAGVKEP